MLASASPRRKKLLAEAGYKFTVSVPKIDESAFEKENWDDVIFYNEFLLTKFESGEEPLVILYPLALAYDNIGRYEDALETYKLFTVRVNTTDPRRDSVLQRIAELEAITGGQASMIPLPDTVLAKVLGGCRVCMFNYNFYCNNGGPIACGMGDACVKYEHWEGYYCRSVRCSCNVSGEHCVDADVGTCTDRSGDCGTVSCISQLCNCNIETKNCYSSPATGPSYCIGTYPDC